MNWKLLGLVLLVSLSLPGCEKDDLMVQYVVPDGYHGYFLVVRDAEHGQTPIRTGARVTLIIPQAGLLAIRDDSFFYGWHSESARSYSGQKLNVHGPDRHGPDEIVLWPLDTTDHKARYLVGTKREYDEYYRRMDTTDPVGEGVRRFEQGTGATTRPD